MNPLDSALSFVTPLQYLGSIDGANEFWIKRDDLIPFCFGGNKARIASEFIRDARASGKTCMVGYGSTRSNLSRALACACSALGIRCVIIVPSEEDGSHVRSFNSMMLSNFGAETVTCDKSAVRYTVRATLERLCDEGENPYYIYGDESGKGNEAAAARAYSGFWDEIESQSNVLFDDMFLACGTGMTMGGLVADASGDGIQCRLTGISVARQADIAEAHVISYAEAVFTGASDAARWRVLDSFLHGGYGRFDSEELESTLSLLRTHGIPLDLTYVGKAFDGMLRALAQEGATGKRVLFLHTGGTPLFFNDISSIIG